MLNRQSSRERLLAFLALLAVLLISVARLASQGASTYTLYSPEGRRAIAFRTAGSVDLVSLDQLATLFDLRISEDRAVGGLTIQSRGQTILLIPDQSFASVGPGRVVSLPAPLQRERNTWQVPVDFIRLALAPALGQRAEIRRGSRVILFGDVRLPAVSGRFERQGANGRLTLQIEPAAPHRVSRDGRRVTVRIDAVALDFSPIAGLAPELATAVRVDGSSVVIDLGPTITGFRADDLDATHIAIDLVGQAPAPPPPPPPAVVPTLPASPAPPSLPQRPAIDNQPGVIRTIVIDPGHGGDDAGALGPGGTKEKDYVLALARRLKTTIESRIGLRVLLTRDKDENVPVDRRTSLANNNEADLFISLHVNASVNPSVAGAQVLSLRLDDYKNRPDTAVAPEMPVPIAGGGTRAIDIVPWNLAQLPFAGRSAGFALALIQRLAEQNVPLLTPSQAQMPLRTLVGANMPAVLVEVGFLTNAAEEKALSGGERSGAIVDAVVDTIAALRAGIPSQNSRGGP